MAESARLQVAPAEAVATTLPPEPLHGALDGLNLLGVETGGQSFASPRLQFGSGPPLLPSLKASFPSLMRFPASSLAVNLPGDPYEQEANRIADQVMRMPAPVKVQRRCAACDEEEHKLHRKCDHCEEEEKKPLRRKETSAGPAAAPPIVHEVLRSPGRPLDAASRAFFEPRFGHDFSQVRIHTDAKAAESAHAVSALAYTVGSHIAFAGKPEQQLLAHELVHVVQQGADPLRSSSAELPSRAPAPAKPALQRQTPPQFTPGVIHDHRPSGRWNYVQWHANSSFWLNLACFFSTPREVASLAISHQFGDKPTALTHLRWYFSGGSADFNEDANLDRWVRSDEHFRRNFRVASRSPLWSHTDSTGNPNRGWMEVPQAFFGVEDFRFSFGAIDRMDFEIDEVAGTVHLWFKDRYEFHPFYPGLYSRFPDDEPRDTNCVHAAMVELKREGAADFWMVGQATFPLRLFAFDGPDILREESADSVRAAEDFLNTLRQMITVDRIRARGAAAAAAGVAEGSRMAHRILNQANIRERLQSGRQIYDAQRPLLDPNHPLLGRFRDTYAAFLTEVREAFDESLALSSHDQQAEREEQSNYGENLIRWLEASPLRDSALRGRTTFTPGDVTASQRQENDLSTVLTNIVPALNLVQPGISARARDAINATRARVTAVGTAAPTRTTATGTTQAAADAAIARIDQAEQTVDRGRTLVHAAIARVDVWLQAPTQPVDVADRVNELFHTRDPGYGALLRSRVQLMLDNLEGRGSLFAHILRPGDTSVCETPTTLGQTPRPYEFVFCQFSSNLDRNAGTLLHELAHAVIPGRGSRSSADNGAPIDRAYAGERLMLRMTTEEALNNAESYSQLIAVLAGLTPETIPTDTVTGCADSGPLLDAVALAQSAHRRAWTYLEVAQSALGSGSAVDPGVQALINTHLGSPSPADLRAMLTDFGNLQADATVWHSGHTFTCVPAASCPANAVAFDNRRAYRSGGFTARVRSISSTPRFCPAFFTLSPDDRARVAHMVVSVSFGNSFLLHKEKAWGYASLALAFYHQDIGAPPASSLAEHQAADAPQTPRSP